MITGGISRQCGSCTSSSLPTCRKPLPPASFRPIQIHHHSIHAHFNNIYTVVSVAAVSSLKCTHVTCVHQYTIPYNRCLKHVSAMIVACLPMRPGYYMRQWYMQYYYISSAKQSRCCFLCHFFTPAKTCHHSESPNALTYCIETTAGVKFQFFDICQYLLNLISYFPTPLSALALNLFVAPLWVWKINSRKGKWHQKRNRKKRNKFWWGE